MRTSRGVTLIEFMMVIILISIVSSLPAIILSQQYKSYYTSKAILLTANKTTIGLYSLIREIRNAVSLSSVESNKVAFINQNGDNIVIFQSNNALMRSVNGGTAFTLSDDLNSLTFGYFDKSYTATKTPDSVVFFTVHLVTQSDLPFTIMSGTVIENALYSFTG